MDMPHYLRMLTYASQPTDDWGPARKENQIDRYDKLKQKLTKSNEQTNHAFDTQPDICSRL